MGIPSGREIPICVCNDVYEKEIQLAIKQGARTIEEVNAKCGACMSCGSCHFLVEKMIDKANPLPVRLPVFNTRRR